MSPRWTPGDFVVLIERLDDCSLGDWDRDFINDMTARLDSEGDLLLVDLTTRQVEQLERMERQYL